jgi:hypothetical protein
LRKPSDIRLFGTLVPTKFQCKKVASYEMEGGCQIYIDLGGELAALLPVLDNCKPGDHIYSYLVKVLEADFREIVVARCLADLATLMGRAAGFGFLASMLIPHPDYVSFFPAGVAVGKIPTASQCQDDFGGMAFVICSLLPVFPEASSLRWYQHRILENVRRSEERTMSIGEVRKSLKNIDID